MICAAEAIAEYGQNAVKIYKSKFNPMYHAVTEHKQPSIMKLVCVGDNEKVKDVIMMMMMIVFR